MAAANLITHSLGNKTIMQRPEDGYMNATAMCQATGKKLSHYTANESTAAFLNALSSDAGIPASELIQTVRGGKGQQGTWVHPHVAIHLAQWLSPEFAVKVSRWVLEWMGNEKTQAPAPKALPDQTQKHYWLTLNNSGNVISQVELKDPTVVSDKVDEVFPEVAVLNRQTVMADMEAMMGYAYDMTTKLNKRMSGLISVLGTPPKATEGDVQQFWKDELRKSSDRLANISGY